jgi:eukaryotic-like serine/threonine-protein kinase
LEIIASVNYERITEIGGVDGKNSKVFEVFDRHLGARLVVKEIEKARIGDPARYFQEARAFHAAKHDRVVPVHWAAERPDHVCIAMPMMAGSLAHEIGSKPVSPRRLIAIAQDICEGIAQVHLANYVHMDIKPTNVLFDAHGRAAITDFGQSLALSALGTADTTRHPLYISFVPPEIADGSAVATPASDVYQIGLTLYRALNGERVFAGELQESRAKFPLRTAIAFGKFPKRVFPPFVPLGIRRALLRALDVDPSQRQVGARALAEELGTVEIKYDWQTELDEPGESRWRLRSPDKADVLVLRLGALPGARVEVWTEGVSGRRRKAPDAWSKDIRTERQLRTALSRTFRAAVE